MGKKKRQRLEVDPVELSAIVERTRGTLGEEDFAKLKAAMDTLAFLHAELQAKGTSIARLRKLLFGAPTEKTRAVLEEAGKKLPGGPEAGQEQKAKRPGHGRNGAAAYTGAARQKVRHATLQGGDACQGCLKGKVYLLEEPAVLVRVTGMAPLAATVWECDRLRCNLCGEVYTAAAPEGVGPEKYDESASAMTGLLKYGTGLPFHRIEKLQEGLGVPLPASTQWELVKDAAQKLQPAFEELVNEAAQADVLHNDDTTMKVLDLSKEQLAAAAAGADEERTGVYTSGLIATQGERAIALFFTGRQHAGENLADVLKRRAAQLKAPVQMSDALAANTSGDFKSILANWRRSPRSAA
jgi:transposase